MASQFKIQFDAFLNTATIRKQIAALQSAQRTIKFKAVMDTRHIKSFTRSLNKLSAVNQNLNGIAQSLQGVSKAAKTTATNMKGVVSATKSTSQGFVDIVGKVAKFGAATAVIGLFTTGVREAAEAIKEFDSALTEMKKVSSYSDKQLASYTNDLAELGSTVARTRSEMTDAATQFLKSGYNENDAKTLAQVAATFQNVADSEMDAGTAASFIVSQMKAFNVDASSAMSIIDKINEVSNNFAVSSTDLSSALTKTSSAMATFGNSSEETLGLVTSAVEIMPNQAGKVARAFRTMGANISKMASSSGKLTYEVGGTTESISLLDETTGDLKSTYSVFSDIADNWDKMSNSEKQALGISIAGKNHLEVFQASLSNFDNAVAATETAIRSAGSATRENERYMTSIEAKVTALKAAFQELSLDVASSGLVKGFLTLTTNSIKLLDVFDGLPVKILAAAGAIKGLAVLSPRITTFASSIGSAFKNNISYISDFIGATSRIKGGTVNKKLGTLGKVFASTSKTGKELSSLAKIVPVLGSVAAAIAVVTIAKKALNKEEIQNNALENYQSQKKALSDNLASIKELENKGLDLTANEEIKLGYLKSQTAELEKQITLAQQGVYSAYGLDDDSVSGSGLVTRTKSERRIISMEDDVDNVNELIKANAKLQEGMENDNTLYEKNTKEIKKNNEEIKATISQYDDLYTVLKEGEEAGTLTDNQKKALEIIENLKDTYKEYSTTVEANDGDVYQTGINKIKDSYNGLAASLKTAKEEAIALKAALDAINNEGDASEKYKESIDIALEDAAGTRSGTSKFWKAAEGVLSADYLKSIDWDFSKAYAEMQKLQAASGSTSDAINNFYAILNSHKNELDSLGVSAEKGADGLWELTGVDASNLAEVAEILHVTPDYLSAMIDAAERYSKVDYWNESLEKSAMEFAKTSGIIDQTTGDIYLYKDALQEAMGLTGSDWSDFIAKLEEMGFKFITDSDNAQKFAQQLVTLNAALGAINSDGTVTMDLTATFEQLQILGFSADEAKEKIIELRESGAVKFTVEGKILTNNKDALKKIQEANNAKAKFAKGVSTTLSANTSGFLSTVSSAVEKAKAKLAELKTSTKSNGGTVEADSEAKGGESQGGLTLVNEEGAELIYGQGEAYIAGGGLPTFVTLKPGDYVYTAKETQQILKNRGKTSFMSRASGTSSYDTLKDKVDNEMDILEHELKLMEFSNVATDSRLAKIKAIQKQLNAYANEFRKIGSEDALKSVRELQDEWINYRDEYLDIIKETHDETIAVMEHELKMSQKNGESEIAQVAKIEAIQQELHKQAEYWRTIDTLEAKQKIRELQNAWWDWEEEIESIYEELADKREEILNKEITQLEAQQSALEWYSDQQQKAIDEKIEALEKEKEALEERNQAEEEAIQLQELEENLAKARASKVKVYRAGLGFVYESDADAISEAQSALNDYNREKSYQKELDLIEEKIQAYEKEKDAWSDVVNNYKDQQDKLETELELGMTMEEYILSQRIENIESFGNAWAKTVEDIIKNQQELKEIEEGTWTPSVGDVMTSSNLSALSNGQVLTPTGEVQTASVSSSGKLQNNVPVGSIVKLNNRYWKVTGGTAGAYTSQEVTLSDYDSTIMSQSKLSALSENQILTPNGNVVTGVISSAGKLQTDVPLGSVLKKNNRYWQVMSGTAGNYSAKEVFLSDFSSYATGSGYIPYSQLARINENGSELIIPPNMNYLYKGTGVVPHTLADNISEIGRMGLSGIKEFIAEKVERSNNNSYNFDQLVLPNVTNAEEFIKELKQLKNFKNMALQKSYSRR